MSGRSSSSRGSGRSSGRAEAGAGAGAVAWRQWRDGNGVAAMLHLPDAQVVQLVGHGGTGAVEEIVL